MASRALQEVAEERRRVTRVLWRRRTEKVPFVSMTAAVEEGWERRWLARRLLEI